LYKLFQIRQCSLARGNILVLGSIVVAIPVSHYPHLRATMWLAFPVLAALFGTVETVRCIQKQWSLYHAAVLLCIYMDLMALSFLMFLFLYPYFLWISHQ